MNPQAELLIEQMSQRRSAEFRLLGLGLEKKGQNLGCQLVGLAGTSFAWHKPGQSFLLEGRSGLIK